MATVNARYTEAMRSSPGDGGAGAARRPGSSARSGGGSGGLGDYDLGSGDGGGSVVLGGGGGGGLVMGGPPAAPRGYLGAEAGRPASRGRGATPDASGSGHYAIAPPALPAHGRAPTPSGAGGSYSSSSPSQPALVPHTAAGMRVGGSAPQPTRFGIDPTAARGGAGGGGGDGGDGEIADIDARLTQLQAFLRATKSGTPLPPVPGA